MNVRVTIREHPRRTVLYGGVRRMRVEPPLLPAIGETGEIILDSGDGEDVRLMIGDVTLIDVDNEPGDF